MKNIKLSFSKVVLKFKNESLSPVSTLLFERVTMMNLKKTFVCINSRRYGNKKYKSLIIWITKETFSYSEK